MTIAFFFGFLPVSVFRRVHFYRLAHRYDTSSEHNLVRLRRAVLHGSHADISGERVFFLGDGREGIFRIVATAIRQVVSLGRQRDFELSEPAVVIVIRGSVRKHVVVRTLLHRGLDGFLDPVGVVERFPAGIRSDLVHGGSVADLLLQRLMNRLHHGGGLTRVGGSIGDGATVDGATGAGGCGHRSLPIQGRAPTD